MPMTLTVKTVFQNVLLNVLALKALPGPTHLIFFLHHFLPFQEEFSCTFVGMLYCVCMCDRCNGLL